MAADRRYLDEIERLSTQNNEISFRIRVQEQEIRQKQRIVQQERQMITRFLRQERAADGPSSTIKMEDLFPNYTAAINTEETQRKKKKGAKKGRSVRRQTRPQSSEPPRSLLEDLEERDYENSIKDSFQVEYELLAREVAEMKERCAQIETSIEDKKAIIAEQKEQLRKAEFSLYSVQLDTSYAQAEDERTKQKIDDLNKQIKKLQAQIQDVCPPEKERVFVSAQKLTEQKRFEYLSDLKTKKEEQLATLQREVQELAILEESSLLRKEAARKEHAQVDPKRLMKTQAPEDTRSEDEIREAIFQLKKERQKYIDFLGLSDEVKQSLLDVSRTMRQRAANKKGAQSMLPTATAQHVTVSSAEVVAEIDAFKVALFQKRQADEESGLVGGFEDEDDGVLVIPDHERNDLALGKEVEEQESTIHNLEEEKARLEQALATAQTQLDHQRETIQAERKDLEAQLREQYELSSLLVKRLSRHAGFASALCDTRTLNPNENAFLLEVSKLSFTSTRSRRGQTLNRQGFPWKSQINPLFVLSFGLFGREDHRSLPFQLPLQPTGPIYEFVLPFTLNSLTVHQIAKHPLAINLFLHNSSGDRTDDELIGDISVDISNIIDKFARLHVGVTLENAAKWEQTGEQGMHPDDEAWEELLAELRSGEWKMNLAMSHYLPLWKNTNDRQYAVWKSQMGESRLDPNVTDGACEICIAEKQQEDDIGSDWEEDNEEESDELPNVPRQRSVEATTPARSTRTTQPPSPASPTSPTTPTQPSTPPQRSSRSSHVTSTPPPSSETQPQQTQRDEDEDAHTQNEFGEEEQEEPEGKNEEEEQGEKSEDEERGERSEDNEDLEDKYGHEEPDEPSEHEEPDEPSEHEEPRKVENDEREERSEDEEMEEQADNDSAQDRNEDAVEEQEPSEREEPEEPDEHEESIRGNDELNETASVDYAPSEDAPAEEPTSERVPPRTESNAEEQAEIVTRDFDAAEDSDGNENTEPAAEIVEEDDSEGGEESGRFSFGEGEGTPREQGNEDGEDHTGNEAQDENESEGHLADDPLSEHESEHASEHESEHASEHESEHASDHASEHASEHDAAHDSEHEENPPDEDADEHFGETTFLDEEEESRHSPAPNTVNGEESEEHEDDGDRLAEGEEGFGADEEPTEEAMEQAEEDKDEEKDDEEKGEETDEEVRENEVGDDHNSIQSQDNLSEGDEGVNDHDDPDNQNDESDIDYL